MRRISRSGSREDGIRATDWLERLDIAGAVIEPTLTFKDGHAVIPDLPGAGIVWREAQIDRFNV
jgi:mandelate racemase